MGTAGRFADILSASVFLPLPLSLALALTLHVGAYDDDEHGVYACGACESDAA